MSQLIASVDDVHHLRKNQPLTAYISVDAHPYQSAAFNS